MGLQGAVAAALCALCLAACLPAPSMPVLADGPSPGEPDVNAPDAHRRQAVWTFPSAAGYQASDVIVYAGWAELAFNLSTGKRAPFGTVTTRDFLAENLTSWDSIEYDADTPEPCRLAFSVSTDGGESWQTVPQNGSLQAAREAGGRMRVRSELRTADSYATPVLRSIWLGFTVDTVPQIASLTCAQGPSIYKREQAVISSKVFDADGDQLSYAWDQTEGPDARLGRTDQPSLTFTPAYNGPHTFRLRVSDGFGPPQAASITLDVRNHPPKIAFELEGTPYKNTPVHIYANVYSADSPLAGYEWRLVSAPSFTTMVQPTKPDIVLHSFYTGECTVELTVTDDQGARGTGNFTFEFIGHPPRALLKAEPNEGHAGKVFWFDASRSFDGDGDRLQYRFDFGDGEATDWAFFSDIAHVYDDSGYYTARVRARDVDGLVTEAQYAVRVKPRNQPPIARLQVSPGNLTEPFTFTSTSEDRDGSIVWTEWDFGDGGVASGPAVSHRFPSPGNYTVRLSVRDDDGEGSSATATININRPPALLSRTPPGDFELGPGQGFNLSVVASDPDGDALSYSWSVNGEPLTSETANVHRFVPGRDQRYDITVNIDDGRGGGTNYTWNLTITPRAGPGPQPVYPLLVIIVVALAAQGVYLAQTAIRARARRRREGTGEAAPVAVPAPLPSSIAPAPPETTPPERSAGTAPMEPPPGIPPPEVPPPETRPPEALPVMEELPEPEPLAQILWAEDRPPPYRRPPPPS